MGSHAAPPPHRHDPPAHASLSAGEHEAPPPQRHAPPTQLSEVVVLHGAAPPHAQVPPAQRSAVAGQGMPQPPQCAVEVLGLVSQPRVAAPSQSWNPVVHMQPPLTHAALAPHELPQPPQWFASVRRLVSQPGIAALQSPKPVSHVVTVQVPVAQLSVAFGRLQATLQPAQSVSVRRLRSHP